MATQSPLIVIVGPTASGKTALALELAKYINMAAASRLESVSVRDREAQPSRTNGTVRRESQGRKLKMVKKPSVSSALPMSRLAGLEGAEIICADSWTVYKGFDIGTAKPSQPERQKVPHHLLDIADPEDGFSAAVFKSLAEGRIKDISHRNKLPIMVGGTGLYIDSVLYNYSFLPAGETNERQKLNQASLEDVNQKVENLGIDTTGIDVRNKRRLIRLIETNGQRPTSQNLRANTLILGMHIPKEELGQRIDSRVKNMLSQGLEAEVKQLYQRYGWDNEPMKGIGYREFRDYFEGRTNLEETKQKIISNTNLLVKKQSTWFKRNKSIHWVTNESESVELLTTFLNKKQ